MTNQESTKADINKLIEFRQGIYVNAFLARRDALFDVLDALVASGPIEPIRAISTEIAQCVCGRWKMEKRR